ncbi:MAG: hypothetical protein PHI16_01550 [Methanocellales archaeon]|nr:hypothetical protein [Methanocellales archaeon]
MQKGEKMYNAWTKKFDEMKRTIEEQRGRIIYYENLIEVIKQATQEKDNLIMSLSDDLIKEACSRERLLKVIRGFSKYSKIE